MRLKSLFLRALLHVVVPAGAGLFASLIFYSTRQQPTDAGRLASDGAIRQAEPAPRVVVLPSRGRYPVQTWRQAGSAGNATPEEKADRGSGLSEAEESRAALEPLFERFEAEERDRTWARESESLLESQLLGYLDRVRLTGVALEHVECRRSSCRVDLAYDSSPALDGLQADLSHRRIMDLDDDSGKDCVIQSTGGDAGLDQQPELHQTLLFICVRRLSLRPR